jgi:translocator protein
MRTQRASALVLFGLAALGACSVAVSGWRMWQKPPSPARTRALALWGTQLALTANWTRLIFSGRNPRAALVDLLALWATLGAYTLQTRTVDRSAARWIAPSLGWMTYASYVNEEAVRKHRKLLLN